MKQWICIVEGYYAVLVAAEIESLTKSKLKVEKVKEVSITAAKMYYEFFKQFTDLGVSKLDYLYVID